MTRAVVLLSGGLDSSTVLASAIADGDEVVAAVTADYGQRHRRELLSATAIANHYTVPQVLLDLTSYGQAVTSALTDPGQPMPTGHYTDETMAATVVPGRNAVLLAAAAGVAASLGARWVVIAAHAGDHPIYPDCRPDFLQALSTALHLGYGITVAAPFAAWSKGDVAASAVKLGVPVDRTWSCYLGGAKHCGRCGTCVERAEALDYATDGQDPTPYADPDFWRTVSPR